MTPKGHRLLDRLRSLTDDELCVLRLDLLLALREIDEDFEKERREREIRALGQDLIETAKVQARPSYQLHLNWCRSIWRQRNSTTDYVPALTGRGLGEYRDWEKPHVMERRAVLRANSTVQELISNHLKLEADSRPCA